MATIEDGRERGRATRMDRFFGSRRLTRRRFAVGAGGALLAAGAFSAGRIPAAAQAATPKAGATALVVDGLGREVVVPASPQRVVALHDLDNAYAVASLGFAPVGVGRVDADRFARVRAFGAIPPDLEQAEDIGLFFEPNLERIAALAPDLILGTLAAHEKVVGQLSAIAPTVLIDQLAQTDPVANQRLQAGILGVEAVLADRLAAYERRVAEVRERHAAELTGLEYTRIDSYGAGPEDTYLLLSDATPGAAVLADLGARRSITNGVAAAGDPFPAISLERLADFDADVILVGVEPGKQPEPRVLALLGGTFAGQREQVFAVDYGVWGFRVVDALHLVLDDLEAILDANDIDTGGDFS